MKASQGAPEHTQAMRGHGGFQSVSGEVKASWRALLSVGFGLSLTLHFGMSVVRLESGWEAEGPQSCGRWGRAS